ncbi:MAG: YtxH domain-containing protein [Acidobacteria bacterium]|nr:YtxH domain-containing protein [Acidobacteriota bacterium]
MDWYRLAAKVGLVLTDPKLRATINDEVHSRASRAADNISSTYDEAVDRLDAAGDALRGRASWLSPTVGFLLGVGVGAGVGILFAPAAGSETRDAIRGRAVEMKNRVVDSASETAGSMRHAVSNLRSTGTEG